jgi:GxxExxY protein
MGEELKGRDPETFAVIGAAMEVHRELRHGMAEAIYRDALAVECAMRRIPFEREKRLSIIYKGGTLPTIYRADFVCFGTLLVECKSLPRIGPAEYAQVVNYLRITGLTRAIVLNFGTFSLTYKRLIYDPTRSTLDIQPPPDDLSL